MKIIRQKQFGAIKKANKQKKWAWEIQQGRKLNYPDLHENWAKELTRAGNLLGSTGAQEVNIINPDTGNKIDFVRSHSKDKYFEKFGKMPLHDKINAKATLVSKGKQVPVGLLKGTHAMTTDYFLSNTRYANNDTAYRLDAARKGTIKLGKRAAKKLGKNIKK